VLHAHGAGRDASSQWIRHELDDQEIKAEKAKFLMGLKSHCTLLLGILSVLFLATLFYLYFLGGILKHYERSEYLRIADFDLKVLETKKAIDSLKIKEMDDELAYRYAALTRRPVEKLDLSPQPSGADEGPILSESLAGRPTTSPDPDQKN